MEQESSAKQKQLLKSLHALFRRTGERIIIGGKSSQQIYLVNPDTLMCIEADQNYTHWYFADGTDLTLVYQLHQCETFITSQSREDSLSPCGKECYRQLPIYNAIGYDQQDTGHIQSAQFRAEDIRI